MALGIPVVVNDLPVLREVIGDTGLFVDVHNISEFSEALETLYLNPGKRRQLGDAAAKRTANYFPLKRTVQLHDTLYRVYKRD